MPKATVNWETVETWQRLVASIYATGVKLDLRAVAAAFGTTYDTLENRMRKIKKDAEALKAGAGDVVVAPTRTKSAPSTPRKTPKKSALETVASGRVGKQTPIKKKLVKQESPADGGSTGGTSDSAAVDTPDTNGYAFSFESEMHGGGMAFDGTDGLDEYHFGDD